LLGTATLDPDSRLDETKIVVAQMLDRGVPREAIHVLPNVVTSTQHEASMIADYAAAHRMKRIVVVTTSFHTARARWIFRKALAGREIDVRMAASTHLQFDESTWYQSDEGLVTYFSEAIKTVYYRLVY
jgi:uncharacterized SAM-binding protein YcdF (DUF218 family)